MIYSPANRICGPGEPSNGGVLSKTRRVEDPAVYGSESRIGLSHPNRGPGGSLH
jgi:hypothetical protein